MAILKPAYRLVFGSDVKFKVHDSVRITIGKDPDQKMLRLVAQASAKYSR